MILLGIFFIQQAHLHNPPNFLEFVQNALETLPSPFQETSALCTVPALQEHGEVPSCVFPASSVLFLSTDKHTVLDLFLGPSLLLSSPLSRLPSTSLRYGRRPVLLDDLKTIP